MTRFGPNKEIHMFPYSRRTSKLLDFAMRLMHGRGGGSKSA